LALVVLVGAVASVIGVEAEGSAPSETVLTTADEAVDEAAEQGAKIFAVNCAVCHGATGLGLDEAKAAFPADHRQCHRCHKPGNPPVMSLVQIEARQHDLFPIGEPPALRGEGALAAIIEPSELREYLRAAMPRYRPGSLSDEEYAALTAFLLHLNGRR
jgi:mono/diheme cytochrome c family protein